jgi:predicted RNA methylase
MATDIQVVLNNLTRFYDFSGKRVLHIGAGGGQFLLNPEIPEEIIAVDNDPAAVRALNKTIKQKNLEGRVKVLKKDFYDLRLEADTVFFEFCLHEMRDPLAALKHAGSLAENVVIMDHCQDSQWAWFVCETEKAAAAWKAAEACGIKEHRRFDTLQHFGNYQELHDKVKVMGKESIRRISRLRDQTNITIPMAYQIGLIS